MKRKYPRLLLFLCLLSLTGCVTVEQVTLPATQKEVYEFDSYRLKPLNDPQWRFAGSNNDLQRVGFLHAKNNTLLIFWVTPLLPTYTKDKADRNIINYFQNKELEAFKKSPDVKLSEQAIDKREEVIDKKSYSILTIPYEREGKKFEVELLYHIHEPGKVIYNIGLFKEMEGHQKDPEWETGLEEDVRKLIHNQEYRTASPEKMMSLRVDFAIDDFNENIGDRYLAEKFDDLKEKYDVAKSEAEEWIRVKDNNYLGYCQLGDLYLFNDKLERYGEGFSVSKAISNFEKSLKIRKYCKTPNVSLAKLYKELGQYEESLKYYDLAIQISPNDDNLYYEAGKMIEEKMGDKDKAEGYYRNALRHWAGAAQTKKELEDRLKK